MPPDRWYNAGRDTLETSFLNRGLLPQIDDPAIIREYFHRLYYSGELDSERIQSMRQKYQFKQVAEAYRLIDNAGEPVTVRWKPFEKTIDDLLMELNRSVPSRRIRERVSSIALGPLLENDGIKQNQASVGVRIGWDPVGQGEQ